MPKLSCPACGVSYWRSKTQIACSRSCSGWLSRGEAARAEQVCKQCKCTFYDQHIRPFCTQTCYWKWKKGKYTEALQKATVKGRIINDLKALRRECKKCKKHYRVEGNRSKHNEYFCSNKCYGKYIQENKSYYIKGLVTGWDTKEKRLNDIIFRDMVKLIASIYITPTKASKILSEKYDKEFVTIRSMYYRKKKSVTENAYIYI